MFVGACVEAFSFRIPFEVMSACDRSSHVNNINENMNILSTHPGNKNIPFKKRNNKSKSRN